MSGRSRAGDPHPGALPRGEVFDWVDRSHRADDTDAVDLSTSRSRAAVADPLANVSRSTTRAGTKSIRRKSATPCCRNARTSRGWKSVRAAAKSDLFDGAHGEATRDLRRGRRSSWQLLLLSSHNDRAATRSAADLVPEPVPRSARSCAPMPPIPKMVAGDHPLQSRCAHAPQQLWTPGETGSHPQGEGGDVVIAGNRDPEEK